MDNAQKALMVGVGLFITVLVITVVLIISNLGVNTTKIPLDKAGGITKSFEDQLIKRYEGRTVAGQDIIYFATQYSEQLAVIVTDKEYDAAGISNKTTTVTPITLDFIRKMSDGIWHSGNVPQVAGDIGPHWTYNLTQFKGLVDLNKNYKTFFVRDLTTNNVTGVLYIMQ